MNSLRLSPIPSSRSEDESASFQIERDGFVDESAVAALLRGPNSTRSQPYPEDLILSVDDMDFAGWQISSAPAIRSAEFPPQVIDAVVRRASPPVIDEPGIGAPHRGSHRWWIAGLAGIFSTMLFSLLLLSLTSRVNVDLKAAPAPTPVVRAKAPQAETPADSTKAAQLTASSLPMRK